LVSDMVSTCSRGGHHPYDAKAPQEDDFAGRLRFGCCLLQMVP
jgi:hypothetical protein